MTAADRRAMRTFSIGRECRVMRDVAVNAADTQKEGAVTHDGRVWEKRATGGSALDVGLTLVRVAVRTHHRAMVLSRATAAGGKQGIAVRSKGGCNRRVAEKQYQHCREDSSHTVAAYTVSVAIDQKISGNYNAETAFHGQGFPSYKPVMAIS